MVVSMITGVQIRSARSALQWSADELALKADVASKTVRRLENMQGIPNTTAFTLAKIQTVLEAAGIEFIGTPDDGPGIRIRT
jgi:ribosome-binding protein aMBF1 (putative translation factor)